MAELADATDLKSVEGKPHGGSSPPGAIKHQLKYCETVVLNWLFPPVPVLLKNDAEYM